ncbi:MAG: hypothetical protein KH452_06035 [Clostridiales bacterium]|nr:hypothetical protein [Clostridiales bacterium]
MRKSESIYQLVNDLLRYLLKYAEVKKFTESDIEQALAESDEIIRRYKNVPGGIGFLAQKLFKAANSYFNELDKRRKVDG